jgi:hypothetical protein
MVSDLELTTVWVRILEPEEDEREKRIRKRR